MGVREGEAFHPGHWLSAKLLCPGSTCQSLLVAPFRAQSDAVKRARLGDLEPGEPEGRGPEPQKHGQGGDTKGTCGESGLRGHGVPSQLHFLSLGNLAQSAELVQLQAITSVMGRTHLLATWSQRAPCGPGHVGGLHGQGHAGSRWWSLVRTNSPSALSDSAKQPGTGVPGLLRPPSCLVSPRNNASWIPLRKAITNADQS